MLPWNTRGFCGVTKENEGSSCAPSDVKGSWAISRDAIRGPVSFLNACLKRCVACDSCRYVSVSQKDKDCSWYRACPLLETSTAARSDWERTHNYKLEHHSFQVKNENGTTVDRVRFRLAKGPLAPTLESEGIRVESLSHDAVCFGATCMSWTAAHAVCSGPGGWRSGLPRPFSACTWPRDPGVLEGSTCSGYATQPWVAFNRSLAWPPSKLARFHSSRLFERLERADAMHPPWPGVAVASSAHGPAGHTARPWR